MIEGVGTDLVEVDRFAEMLARRGSRFVERVFTGREQAEAGEGPLRSSRLAARWAAKEATVKALGTGFRTGKWRDVEVARDGRGAPRVHLHGEFAATASALGVIRLHLSLTHTGKMAMAVVIAESEGSR